MNTIQKHRALRIDELIGGFILAEFQFDSHQNAVRREDNYQSQEFANEFAGLSLSMKLPDGKYKDIKMKKQCTGSLVNVN
jgi:hypothetical protein